MLLIEKHELSKDAVRASYRLGVARPGKHFSTRPLAELKRTGLEGMKARKTHLVRPPCPTFWLARACAGH